MGYHFSHPGRKSAPGKERLHCSAVKENVTAAEGETRKGQGMFPAQCQPFMGQGQGEQVGKGTVILAQVFPPPSQHPFPALS